MAARKKASSKKSAAANGAARGIGAIWKFIAKTLGSSIRFIFRGAQDLDPAHQRDGIAFLIFILGLISAAGVWFSLDNIVGHGIYAAVFGLVGRLGIIAPIIFIYFAFRLFRAPDESKATGRIIIGTLVLLISITGLLHILNGSTGTGQTAIRHGGGEEGCLSFPGLVYETPRAFRAVAKGFNVHGEPVTIEGSELLARVFQHETDHLNGIVFIDRLLVEERKIAMSDIRNSEWFGNASAMGHTPIVRISPHQTNGRAL